MQAIKHAFCAIVKALRATAQGNEIFADHAIYSLSVLVRINNPQKKAQKHVTIGPIMPTQGEEHGY
ncbi:hypothetical protein GA0061071_108218 [Kosakonia oryzendophytica]|uniref:Uncharacterized protein n=1 Tax=Kosakonia oryzendophytica TaxID=1005665 RepID=A0A1C4CSF8_9ENTR|nr:hypothetical protein DFO53_2872 [Enterobacter sp. AG5470]SCC22010.1 hypothetical protein GA0061071_108218 [Kosakonia oryzendophytica]